MLCSVVEGDIDFASVSKSVAIDPINTHNSRLSALGTVRGRVGLAFDRFLPYVTGGVAFASLKNELFDISFHRQSGQFGDRLDGRWRPRICL